MLYVHAKELFMLYWDTALKFCAFTCVFEMNEEVILKDLSMKYKRSAWQATSRVMCLEVLFLFFPLEIVWNTFYFGVLLYSPGSQPGSIAAL